MVSSMTHGANLTRKRLRGDAAQWFVEFRDGAMDAQRREMFDAWLRTSPEHIRAYLEVSAFWADVPEAFVGRDIDVEAIVAAAREEDGVVVPLEGGPIRAAANNSTAERRGTNVRRAVALAACLLISVMIGVSWMWAHRGVEYQTDIGEQRSIVLSDGSTMDLNARSRVQIRFEADVRNVRLLEGQALFKVAKDASRPFIVDTGSSRVRAVGTQFDVYRRNSATTVTVVEGRVAILAPAEVSQRALAAREQVRVERGDATNASVEVAAGEQVKVAAGEISAPVPTNADFATAWTRRQIILREAPLSDVVDEFNRYNRRQMTIGDPAVASVLISGVFSSRDPGALLRFLREMPMFVVDETDHEIRILASPSMRSDSG